jgi:hypothetical protein
MIRKKILGVLVGGLVGLTAQPSGAGALITPGDGDRVLVSSEKAAAAAPSLRPRAAHRHWRHRGGRHPFYGSGH